jgi:hypothetical protein
MHAKQTLTWNDVLCNKNITLASCVECGISTEKLHRMQPAMIEWIRSAKATIADFHLMQSWRPNPFIDLRCSIGDVVIHRFPAQTFTDCNITFNELRDRYGMGHEIMGFLRYTPDEWASLGMGADFLDTVSDAQLDGIFGKTTSRKALRVLIQARQHA